MSVTTGSVCPEGQIECAGVCLDPTTDPENCGDCGTVCDPGTACMGGACFSTCGPDEAYCAGNCVDMASDVNNCGDCGFTCEPGELCVDGACALECPMTHKVCGGVCIDPASDENNCGDCANECVLCQRCETGACVAVPPPAQGEITGKDVVCANAMEDYEVIDAPGPQIYNWTVPQGAEVVAGYLESKITVKFGAESGQVCVVIDEGCGASPESCLDVTVKDPCATATAPAPGRR